MAIRFKINEEGRFTAADVSDVVCRAGICTGGVEGDIIELAAGQDPTPVLGFGAAVAAAACHSRLAGSRHLFVKVPATTAGTISSITETPGGAPNITVTGSDFDGVTGSPFDAYNGVVRVAKTGDLGDCVVDVSLDGGTFPYTYDVPPAAVPIRRPRSPAAGGHRAPRRRSRRAPAPREGPTASASPAAGERIPPSRRGSAAKTPAGAGSPCCPAPRSPAPPGTPPSPGRAAPRPAPR